MNRPGVLRRLGALATRERQTRYAGGWIGPYWAQLTPVVWIGFLVYLFSVLDRAAPIHTPVAVFIATGVLPYIMFRQIITSLMRSVIANRHLKYIQPVNQNELLIATSCVEVLNAILTAGVVFGLLVMFAGALLPAIPVKVALGFALSIGLAIGFGRLAAAIGLLSDSFARFIPIALRPFFWISGIFYSANELSKAQQDLLWYSPLFHVTEIVREGFFLGYVSPIAEPWYPVAIICLLYLSSLLAEEALKTSHRPRYRI